MIRAWLFAVGILLASAVVARFAHAQEGGAWLNFPAMPSARAELPHAALEGRVYVPGGFAANRGTRIVEVYEARSRTWTKIADLPIAMHHLHMAATDRAVYVLGGYEGSSFTPTSRVFEYDSTSDRWIDRAPMPTPRGAGAAVYLDGRIYVVGGASFGTSLTTVESYDPTTDTWQEHASMSLRREHLAAAVIDSLIYVVGGRSQTALGLANTAALEAYSPTRDRWSRLASMPTPRGGLAAAALKGRLYAFGGEIPGTFDETESYDPRTNTWESNAPMTVARHGIGAVAVGDTIYVIAGAPIVGFSTTNVNTGFVPPTSTASDREEPEALPGSMTAFPNPARDQVRLHMASRYGSGHVELVDVLGRRVLRRNIPESDADIQIDLSGVAPGLYFAVYFGGAEQRVVPIHRVR